MFWSHDIARRIAQNQYPLINSYARSLVWSLVFLFAHFLGVGFHYMGVYVHVSMYVYPCGVVCMWLNNGTAWLERGGYWCGIFSYFGLVVITSVCMCGVGNMCVLGVYMVG